MGDVGCYRKYTGGRYQNGMVEDAKIYISPAHRGRKYEKGDQAGEVQQHIWSKTKMKFCVY